MIHLNFKYDALKYYEQSSVVDFLLWVYSFMNPMKYKITNLKQSWYTRTAGVTIYYKYILFAHMKLWTIKQFEY